jgi:hypothetical protein
MLRGINSKDHQSNCDNDKDEAMLQCTVNDGL